MFIPFGEWAPDAAELNSARIGDILNVLSAGESYIPFPAIGAFSAALASAPYGRAFVARSLSGQITVFVGTATKLFKMDNTDATWDDVSQAATTYAASATATWSFAQFGEYVIAVNVNDDPQVYQLGVSTTFLDLAGSPPRAAVVKIWGDYVALMGLASNPDRVHWSALNDHTGWTPGTNGSDYQTFPDGGKVQGSTEATNPLIFLERSIFKATLQPGSVEIFTFQKIHDRRGAASADSIASRGSFTFYADQGGFFQIGQDGSIAPIGFLKVDKTLFGLMTAPDSRSIMAAIDPFYSRVYWAFKVGSASSFNRLAVYDWDIQRWTIAEVSMLSIFPAATTGYTLENLVNVSASLDALPFSLDSKAWQGGAPLLGAMGTDNTFSLFNDLPMEATLTTQERGDVAGGVSTVLSSYPAVDTATLYVSLGSRLRRQDNFTWTDEASPSAYTGRVRKKKRGRFHSVKVRIPAGTSWTHAQGVDVEMVGTGSR
jgi:hypothetical protein